MRVRKGGTVEDGKSGRLKVRQMRKGLRMGKGEWLMMGKGEGLRVGKGEVKGGKKGKP